MEHQGPVLAEQALESCTLDLAYERSCRHVEVTNAAEMARLLKVQTLLLEDENDDLHEQLAQNDERIDLVEKRGHHIQMDLESCQGHLESAQCDLRIKVREIETLKAELESLHGVTMDSTRMLTEKLTIARELSSLKPELDHLRAQASSHQSLLAEKLFLQRQLSTVHVELETEKRSTQRALAKENKLQAEDARLQSQIEILQADLGKERRERQRLELETQKLSTNSGNRVTMLESRLDAFRSKLKSTKEQLRESQASLRKAETSASLAASRVSAIQAPSWALTQRKRPAVQMDAGSMIGTPGDIPAAKRGRKTSALLGEKSTFSITPFLTRTASVAPESPPPIKENKDNGNVTQSINSPTTRNKAGYKSVKATSDSSKKADKTMPVLQGKKPDALNNGENGGVSSKPLTRLRPNTALTLELVMEEDNDDIDDVDSVPAKQTRTGVIVDDTINEGKEIKKKKRKLLGGVLGKTLFDEDDGDAVGGERGIMGGTRGIGISARGGLNSTKFGARKALGASSGIFGAISPLKKDRQAT